MPSSTSTAAAYLVIDQDGRWSDVYRLHRGQVAVLGRSSDCDIVVRTDGVSRRHTEIFYDESSQAWMVKDLGSRNGTFLDGQSVLEPTPLANDQMIQIVGFAVRYTDDPDTQPSSINHPPTETQATISLDPKFIQAQIQARIEHSGWVCGGDEAARLGQQSSQTLTTKQAKSRAALLQISFEIARASELAVILQTAVDFLCRTGGVTHVSIVPDQTTDHSKVVGLGGETAIALVAAHQSNPNAVLARNIGGDDQDSQNSLADLGIDCAIVAPIGVVTTSPSPRDPRLPSSERVWGYVVVTTAAGDPPLDGDDLRNVVATCEILALRLSGLTQTRQLAKTLERSRQQVRWLRETLGDRVEIIGRSEAIAAVLDQIRKVASTPSTVLIRGESGVGKELVAAAIHYASDRRDGPLVCLNCAAISPSLLESELFGHEQGAFTGADSRRRGKFESAHRGTILLDEIGEMSAETQTKFLRVLENRSLERVGGQESISVDVRVIAATHRDLRSMVDQGKFRQDLYYRLHVIELTVPPLRDRGDDILLLANHFLKRFAREMGRPIDSIDETAAKRLRQYQWPGNIRELRNAIERAVVLSDQKTLSAEDLLLTPAGTQDQESDSQAPVEISLAELESRHIDRVLSYTENNKTRAASILGIERSTLDRKLKRRQKQTDVTQSG